MKYEIKKLWFDHKMLHLFLLFQLVAICILFFGDQPANQDISNNLDGYTYYLKKCEGRITKKTDTFFEQEADTLAERESEYETIYKKVSDGKMTVAACEKRLSKLNVILGRNAGFEALYEQYKHAKEQRSNRYLLNTNAWEGLLTEEHLDYALLLFSCILACVCFGSEINSEMDVMLRIAKNGKKRIAREKLALVVFGSVIFFILEYLLELIFLQNKYGFTHGGYPVQSISYFQEYDKTASLIDVAVGCFLWKLFGCVLWTVLVSAAIIWLRKYTLAMIVSLSGMVLSYVGITAEYVKYRIPGPLGAMLAAGFYRGTIVSNTETAGKNIFSYIQLSETRKMWIFLIDFVLLGVLIFYIISKYSNCWNKKRFLRRKAIASLIIFLIGMDVLTGCSKYKKENQTYNLKNCQNFETDKYIVYSESNEQGEEFIMAQDKNTGERTRVVKDVFRNNKDIADCFYAMNNYVYYIETTKDRETVYGADELGEMRLIRVDMRNFSTKIVFRINMKTISEDILGITKKTNENFFRYAELSSFLVSGDYFYIVSGKQVYEINLITKKQRLLFAFDGINLSFQDGVFYYTDHVSRLVQYNTHTKKAKTIKGVVAEMLQVAGKHIVYEDRTNNGAITCTDLNGKQKKVLYKKENFGVYVDTHAVYYLTENNELHKVDYNGLEKNKIKLKRSGMVYVFFDYNKILYDDYGKVTEYNK